MGHARRDEGEKVEGRGKTQTSVSKPHGGSRLQAPQDRGPKSEGRNPTKSRTQDPPLKGFGFLSDFGLRSSPSAPLRQFPRRAVGTGEQFAGVGVADDC